MKKPDIKAKFLDIGEGATNLPPSRVRTKGGSVSSDPPFAVLDYETVRINGNGANPLGGYTRDEAGNVEQEILHRYYQFEGVWIIRSNDELKRDKLEEDLEDGFADFERYPGLFDEDTRNWEVGDAKPTSNPVVEPDYYESKLTIRFEYLRRKYRDADVLLEIQKNESVEEIN